MGYGGGMGLGMGGGMGLGFGGGGGGDGGDGSASNGPYESLGNYTLPEDPDSGDSGNEGDQQDGDEFGRDRSYYKVPNAPPCPPFAVSLPSLCPHIAHTTLPVLCLRHPHQSREKTQRRESREKRRKRAWRRAIRGNGQPPLKVSCAEDILSDSDSSEREEDAAVTRRDNLMAAAEVVFEDVEPEYTSLQKMKESFEGWKRRFPGEYRHAINTRPPILTTTTTPTITNPFPLTLKTLISSLDPPRRRLPGACPCRRLRLGICERSAA